MQYASPELVVVGKAEVLVLGAPFNSGDNGGSDTTQLPMGLTAGLDD